MGFNMNEVKKTYDNYKKQLNAKIMKNQKNFCKFITSESFGNYVQEILVEDASIGAIDQSVMHIEFSLYENRISLYFLKNKSWEMSDTSGEGVLGDLSYYFNTLISQLSNMGLKVLEKPITEEELNKLIAKQPEHIVNIAIRMSFRHAMR